MHERWVSFERSGDNNRDCAKIGHMKVAKQDCGTLAMQSESVKRYGNACLRINN